MIYGFLTFTTLTTISETSWSMQGRLAMPSGVSTTTLEVGLTVFIKGTNSLGKSQYHKFIVNRTTYVRGKLTVYLDYNDVTSDIYAPNLENPYGVITSRGTNEGFYFLPTTELNTAIPQSDLDYIRNLDLQERDYNYDQKMQRINAEQDVFMNENRSNIADLQQEDINIYKILGLIADGGTFDESDDSND